MNKRPISFYLTLTILSSVLLVTLTRRTPQTIYGDPAYQLKALQQYRAGESSSFNRLTTPDPKNLTKDVTEWFSWWPPGPQLAVYPFLVTGISIGAAVRLIAIGFVFLGCIGWVLWFNCFDLPRGVQLGWALLVPWMRYANNGLFAFSGEVFAFGLAPWILVGTQNRVQACQSGRERFGFMVTASALLGLGLGLCYVLKYNIVFASIAALIYFGSKIASETHEKRRRMAASFFASLLGFLIPVVALNVLNHLVNHDMNPVVSTAGFNGKLASVPWIVALPALALTDAYSMLCYVFLHPIRGLYPHEYLLCLLGLPGGILLLRLLYRQRGGAGSARLAILTLGTSGFAMLLIWNLTQVGNYDGRYLAIFSLAVLPVAVEEGFVVCAQEPAS